MNVAAKKAARVVTEGVKIIFEDLTDTKIVFANDPATPADIPHGTIIQMQTPITLIGGRQILAGDNQATAEFFSGVLHFKVDSFDAHDIRGGNWGVVVWVPRC